MPLRPPAARLAPPLRFQFLTDSTPRRAPCLKSFRLLPSARNPFSCRHRPTPSRFAFPKHNGTQFTSRSVLDGPLPPPLFSSHFMHIHPLDLAIVVLCLLGVTALGIYFRRGQQDVRDYFLGGRTAPWWAIAFSIVSTETSTLTIIGTPAIAYGRTLTFLPALFGYFIGRSLILVFPLPGIVLLLYLQ